MSSFRDNLTELLGKYPITDEFIEDLRKFATNYCQLAPVRVYNLHRAERRIEQAACEAIGLFWQDRFGENSWFPITIHPGWPKATCVIKTKPRPIAIVSFQIGPETDGERGGVPIEPIEFPVLLKPPNIISRAFSAFNKRDQKAEREKELAPVGTPDFKPELKLNKPLPAAKAKPPEAPKAARKLPAKATLRKP